MPGDDPEDPDYEKTLKGVIVYNHQAGAYWPEGSEYDDNVPPLCSSVDGKLGIGTPGGSCALCELNKFGTDGKGKACKNMRHLYILRSRGIYPDSSFAAAHKHPPVQRFYERILCLPPPPRLEQHCGDWVEACGQRLKHL